MAGDIEKDDQFWKSNFLGSFASDVIVGEKYINKLKYYEILLNDRRFWCIMTENIDSFPLIVEDIKQLFNVDRIGLNTAEMNKKNMILYKILNVENDIILKDLKSSSSIRKNDIFRRKMQKQLVLLDILFMDKIGESSIRIRHLGEHFVPVSMNTIKIKNLKDQNCQFCILGKSLIAKWFDETRSPKTVLQEMVIETFSEKIDKNDFSALSNEIITKIETIIIKYNSNYKWYANFISNRIINMLM